jgi:hypothetical protein
MPQIINNNIVSLKAQRNLNRTQGGLSIALHGRSSGLRINSAKDNAVQDGRPASRSHGGGRTASGASPYAGCVPWLRYLSRGLETKGLTPLPRYFGHLYGQRRE